MHSNAKIRLFSGFLQDPESVSWFHQVGALCLAVKPTTSSPLLDV